MSNQKLEKKEAQPRLQQYQDVKVFGLVDGQGKPLVQCEGLVLSVGAQIYALSEDGGFEECGEFLSVVSAGTLEDVCMQTWEENFSDVEDVS